MGLIDIEKAIVKLGRPVFTTREIEALTGISQSATIQTLSQLEKAGLLLKIKRGLWCDARRPVNPFDIVPYLLPNQPLYVSFTSALHLHGVIEQIPQITTVATLSHSRTIRTKYGTYRLHQICKELFDGYDWYKSTGNFLIASPTKALVDCVYISGRKGKAFASFPELNLNLIKLAEAKSWACKIPHPKVRNRVLAELEKLYSK